jgi:hypothetical protein
MTGTVGALRRMLVPLIAIFACHAAVAQNAPVTTAASAGNAVPGSQVTLPVTVTGFTNIGSVTLCLDYDYSKIHFVSGTKNPLLPGIFNIGDHDLGTGMHRVIAGWYGSATSLTDGTWILNLVFTYLSGTATLQWYDNGPSCEYTNGSGTVLNDIPTNVYYLNGMICGVIGNPGIVTGADSVCQGQTGVPYSVQTMANVTGYSWQVPPGALIATGNNTNSITVDYPAGTSSGNITVNGFNECGNGPVSQLAVTVSPLPAAGAGNDTIIPYGTSTQLHAASGGSGSFSYHWSPESLLVNPDVQDPVTVILTSTTLFQLTVTNQATLCQNSDGVSVSITGGPLSTNPTVIPGEVCMGAGAQLYANAGGGSGIYTYSWTCTPPGTPPWTSNLENPVVTPDTTTQYNVTVWDGFTSSPGSTTLVVHGLPTAVISGGDTLCDDGSTAPIRIDLTGTPPWSFSYSNGISTWTISNQTETPFMAYTSDPGTYTVLSVQDLYCPGHGTGAAPVVVYPVPPTPTVTLQDFTLYSSTPVGNQWYRDLILVPGATAPEYTATQTGTYFTIVTIQGCPSDTSNFTEVVFSGLRERPDDHFELYPNPSGGVITVRALSAQGPIVKLRIFSATGILEKELLWDSCFRGGSQAIDCTSLVKGVHLVFLQDNISTLVYKLILF